ncbi:hypothetical protein ACM66B_002724 [Microbotryomycetes sp. NB124-2]
MADSLGYTDAEAYLRQPQFHRSTTYTSDALGRHKQLQVSYAVGGAFEDPQAPTLVWINGLGGHRLSIAILDGICLSYGVKVITFDRPGAGLSSSSEQVPLACRIPVTYDSLMAVLKKEHVTKCSILSHSNGLVYSFYTVLRQLSFIGSSASEQLDDEQHRVVIYNWILTSPWVSSQISGSLFGLASYLPEQLTSRLGLAANWFTTMSDVGTGVWQGMSGMLSWSSGISAGMSGSSVEATQPLATSSTPTSETRTIDMSLRQRYNNYVRSQSKKPLHKRFFPGLFIGPNVFSKAMSMALSEGSDAMGQEALLCLRKGQGSRWHWTDKDAVVPDEQEEAAMVSRDDDEALYRAGFERVQQAVEANGDRSGQQLRVCLWQAADDGMVPERGRRFLETLLVESLGLVKQEDSHTVPEAGHDDMLSLECVMRPVLELVASSSQRRA